MRAVDDVAGPESITQGTTECYRASQSLRQHQFKLEEQCFYITTTNMRVLLCCATLMVLVAISEAWNGVVSIFSVS